ncbi:MAG: alpha/beta hydrolase [Alphaproteobacteria bacterium]|nr:alpha/beta hydrolase [Alphaproteobacteria bacterium]
MNFTEKSFTSTNSKGTHRIVYSDWGNEDGKPLIAVHGLTGNGHDFDYIAPELVKDGYRVIAVDLPGRGRSDFLSNPMDYNYKQYFHDLDALLKYLNLQQVDWLGVSLGGLLGIKIAGEENTPIHRLILNDVGPIVPKPALDFIHTVISQEYRFDTIQDLEARMRATRGLTWGPVTDEQWRYMAEHNARALEDGAITYGYDPRIAEIFKTEPIGDSDLWPYWDNIKCPVLLLHGKMSVVLTKPLVEEMEMRYTGQALRYHVFKDCGHVPSLMADNQIIAVKQWMAQQLQ